MNTISGVYGAGEAAVMSVQAGIDIVLMPEDFDAGIRGSSQRREEW